MPSEITMPQLSDTMAEGTVVKWHKKEGDAIKSGEEIADIETDKATMPMESFDSGTLAFIAAPEGQKVKVGQLLAVVALADEDAKAVREQAQQGGGAPAAASAVAAAPRDVETDHPKMEAQRTAAREQQAAAPAPEAPGRVRISPLAKRIADDKGIDLSQVRGSGPGGRIVERDLLAATEKPAPKPAVPAPAQPAQPLPPVLLSGQKQVFPLTKMRSAIAAALLRSKQTIPHFYETIDIDLEAVMRLRERLNKQLEKEKVRLSVADFIMKGAATALLRHPEVNARFNPDKNEITRYGDVNLGIAVSVPDGLIVPVLRGVNQMGLRDLRIRSLDLVERARALRLKKEEQTDATFTISSLGSNGIREFSAIINPPEVAILAVGAAAPRAVVRDGQIVARTTLTVTLSADHRVVDGAVAADFLATLRDLLEEPGMMLV